VWRHVALHGSVLQGVTGCCASTITSMMHPNTLQHGAAHCSILQHAATHCNTLLARCIPIALCKRNVIVVDSSFYIPTVRFQYCLCCLRFFVYTYMFTYIYICIYIYHIVIHIYIYIYIHTYTYFDAHCVYKYISNMRLPYGLSCLHF